MRIDSFWIQNYKNLKDITIDFDQNHWVTVVIGWNGTGKSNVLEALLTVFRDLVLGENLSGTKNSPSFCYKLRYKCRGTWVHIDADPKRKPGYVIHTRVADKDDLPANQDLGIPVTTSQFIKNQAQYLPEYIFGYYSGESRRLESIFEKYTTKYDKELRAGKDPGLKRLFYALPVHSNFVLLSFIINDTELTKKFLHEQLGLEDGGIDSVLFVCRKPSWSSKKGDPRFWNARGIVSDFLAKIYDISLAPIRISRTVDKSLWGKQTVEFLYLYIKDLASLKKIASGTSPREFFRNLESTYVSELIEEVRIRIKLRKNDGSITFRELSEGEQQLLTVLGLLHFTAEQESLFLLDEPDTHLNPRWSVEYLKHLQNFVSNSNGEQDNSHIILTTHNPLAVAELEKEQVQILKRDKDDLSISAHMPEVHPRGMGYAGVVTSELFGLDAALDSYTQNLLEKKRLLTAKSTLSEADQTELKKLNSELELYGFRYEFRDPVYTEYIKLRHESDIGAAPRIEQTKLLSLEDKEKAKQLIEKALGIVDTDKGG